MARILVIDNYDSFVYNIVSYLAQIGAEVEVWRNDDDRFLDSGWPDAFDGVLLSPGPGVPEKAGVCVEVIKSLGGRKPIFGVCLGLQAMGVALGGVVNVAPELMHGKTSAVTHDDSGVLEGLPSPFTATRYHSLVVDRAGLPDELDISAEAPDGTIMGLRHRTMPVEGIQFHPESVLSTDGPALIRNWVNYVQTYRLDRVSAA